MAYISPLQNRMPEGSVLISLLDIVDQSMPDLLRTASLRPCMIYPPVFWILSQPIMLRPYIDIRKTFKICRFVYLSSSIAPKETRHARERLSHDHLTGFTRVRD